MDEGSKEEEHVAIEPMSHQDALDKLAMEEILLEAKRGAERAKDMGPAGWMKPVVPPTNKRFLKNTLVSTLRNPIKGSRRSPGHGSSSSGSSDESGDGRYRRKRRHSDSYSHYSKRRRSGDGRPSRWSRDTSDSGSKKTRRNSDSRSDRSQRKDSKETHHHKSGRSGHHNDDHKKGSRRKSHSDDKSHDRHRDKDSTQNSDKTHSKDKSHGDKKQQNGDKKSCDKDQVSASKDESKSDQNGAEPIPDDSNKSESNHIQDQKASQADNLAVSDPDMKTEEPLVKKEPDKESSDHAVTSLEGCTSHAALGNVDASAKDCDSCPVTAVNSSPADVDIESRISKTEAKSCDPTPTADQKETTKDVPTPLVTSADSENMQGSSIVSNGPPLVPSLVSVSNDVQAQTNSSSPKSKSHSSVHDESCLGTGAAAGAVAPVVADSGGAASAAEASGGDVAIPSTSGMDTDPDKSAKSEHKKHKKHHSKHKHKKNKHKKHKKKKKHKKEKK